jgi:hypothetical protein
MEKRQMARFFVVAILLVTLCSTASALAKRTGDLFEDQGIAVQNRPWVPSDHYQGYRMYPDMFRPQQPYIRTNKDMFDFMPVPPNPGIEHRFSAHPERTPVPASPLFHNPNIPD